MSSSARTTNKNYRDSPHQALSVLDQLRFTLHQFNTTEDLLTEDIDNSQGEIIIERIKASKQMQDHVEDDESEAIHTLNESIEEAIQTNHSHYTRQLQLARVKFDTQHDVEVHSVGKHQRRRRRYNPNPHYFHAHTTQMLGFGPTEPIPDTEFARSAFHMYAEPIRDVALSPVPQLITLAKEVNYAVSNRLQRPLPPPKTQLSPEQRPEAMQQQPPPSSPHDDQAQHQMQQEPAPEEDQQFFEQSPEQQQIHRPQASRPARPQQRLLSPNYEQQMAETKYQQPM